jgi:hypothetical protein
MKYRRMRTRQVAQEKGARMRTGAGFARAGHSVLILQYLISLARWRDASGL